MLWFLLFKEKNCIILFVVGFPDCVTKTKTNVEKFGKKMTLFWKEKKIYIYIYIYLLMLWFTVVQEKNDIILFVVVF